MTRVSFTPAPSEVGWPVTMFTIRRSVLMATPRTQSIPAAKSGSRRSGQSQLLSLTNHQARHGAPNPVGFRRQDHRGRADEEGGGVAAGGRNGAIAERHRRVQEAPAHVDDGGVAAAQMLAAAVDDGAL